MNSSETEFAGAVCWERGAVSVSIPHYCWRGAIPDEGHCRVTARWNWADHNTPVIVCRLFGTAGDMQRHCPAVPEAARARMLAVASAVYRAVVAVEEQR